MSIVAITVAHRRQLAFVPHMSSTFTSSINTAAGSDESAQWHTWPARPEARSISGRVHGLTGYGSPLRLVRGRGVAGTAVEDHP
ncbi:hypothetical protein B5807_00767 [Epicoccum nigrum]|uniref:Uncharacterized protein n=1 Tax=Epicoccum nigrum TaxID=105696 RepID=A0A1Y2MDL8_EPING|nr:hypothetical protein B5807_00767 [Epicoccum nigrum]